MTPEQNVNGLIQIQAPAAIPYRKNSKSKIILTRSISSTHFSVAYEPQTDITIVPTGNIIQPLNSMYLPTV